VVVLVTDHRLPPVPAGGSTVLDRFTQSAALVDGLDPVFAGPLFDGRDPRLAGVFMRGSRQVRLDITVLPLIMRREVGWWLATCARTGERQAHASEWNRWAATAADVIARHPHVVSFADRPLAEWMTAWARRFHADRGRMPAPGHRLRAEHALRGMLERLLRQYATEVDWWRHDIWSLRLDARIPRREHEPRANTAVRWGDITPPWLREGTKFYLRLQMESGQLTWSTVMQNRVNTARFASFVGQRGIDHPALADGSERSLRALALDFGTFLHHWQRETPGRAEVGGSLQPRTINKNLQTIDQFYRVMTDCRTEAAEALDDVRWRELTDSHARMFRPADRPRHREVREADERNYINDTDLSGMLTHIELLGLPTEQTRTVVRDARQVELAGLGHPAVMRAWLIQAMTGRPGQRSTDDGLRTALRHPRPGRRRRSRGRHGRKAPLPADEDRCRAEHHPRRPRRRRDHPGTAGMGTRTLAPGPRRHHPLPVPEDHRQPARHQVLGDQQLQPRPERLQPPPGPA
jgi:hypothetical protein